MIILRFYLNLNFFDNFNYNKIFFIGLDIKNYNFFYYDFFLKKIYFKINFFINFEKILLMILKFKFYFFLFYSYLYFFLIILNLKLKFNFNFINYFSVFNYLNSDFINVLDYFIYFNLYFNFYLYKNKYYYNFNIKNFFFFYKKNFLNVYILKIFKNIYIVFIKYLYKLNRIENYNLINYFYFLFNKNIIIIFYKNNYILNFFILNKYLFKSFINNLEYIVVFLKKYINLIYNCINFKYFYIFLKNILIISLKKILVLLNLNFFYFFNILNLINYDFIFYKNNIFINSFISENKFINYIFKIYNFKNIYNFNFNRYKKFFIISDLLNYNIKYKNFFKIKTYNLINYNDNLIFTNNLLAIKILNYNSFNFSVLKSTLIISIIKSLIINNEYIFKNIKLYELGKIYYYDFKIRNEKLKLRLIKEKSMISFIFNCNIKKNFICIDLNFIFFPIKYIYKYSCLNKPKYSYNNILILLFDRTLGYLSNLKSSLINIYNFNELISLEIDFVYFNLLNYKNYLKIFFIKRDFNFELNFNINFFFFKIFIIKYFNKYKLINYYYDLIFLNNLNKNIYIRFIFFNLKNKILDFFILKLINFLNKNKFC